MDIATLITSLSPWLLFILTIFIGMLATEVGVWVSRKTLPKDIKLRETTGSLMGPMLALLAFMLGFTFSITSSRFASRRELVVQQAQALSTCYLRTALVPAKQKHELATRLVQYTDMLVGLNTAAEVDPTIPRLEKLNMEIWDQAATLLNENMDSELRALYVQSINEVLEIYQKRKTVGLVYRIRSPIWTTLYLLFFLNMFLVGFEISGNKRRRVFNTALMAIAFALIVTLIADMDSRADSRNFKANLQPLNEVQKMMHDKGLN